MKNVIVGTAGHIDHGKTALVKALTGIDCDRWEEEKRRGITIDIGFAGMDLSADLHLGFVDVPGHERFVKNMLAGAHGMDILMLVVAADESVMPQTREHFEITKLLDVKTGLTVVTKADLVDAAMREVVVEELRVFLRNSFLEKRPIVCVSSKTGEGMAGLKEQLGKLAAEIPSKNSTDHFRLPIDRAFTMKGFGTVVTGTLISGRVSREDELEVFPQRQRVRVRGIQVHNHSVPEALAGQRTAINLQGIDVGDLRRGMVLAPPNTFQPTPRVDVQLNLLDAAPAPLKNRDRVHFHHGTFEMIATVLLLEKSSLKPGETVLAQMILAAPTLALPGDRFVIRRLSPVVTIGGGKILDPLPERHDSINEQSLEFLRAASDNDRFKSLRFLISESHAVGVTIHDLVARTGLLPAVLRALLEKLQKQGEITELPTRVVSTAPLADWQNRMLSLVQEHHARTPLATGISKQELKERLGARVSTECFEFLIGRTLREKLLQVSGDAIHIAGRRVALSTEEDAGKKMILEAFRAAGLAVPFVDEVLAKLKIDRVRAKQIVQLLVKERILVRVTTDLMFHSDSIAKLIQQLQSRKTVSPRLTVGQFKEMTGITRKYAIPLLEYLDRERVTRREGDERMIL